MSELPTGAEARDYARGLASSHNPYRKSPLRGCWARGYAAALAGAPIDGCPYVSHSSHGGTWGYQAQRAWGKGWAAGRGATATPPRLG